MSYESTGFYDLMPGARLEVGPRGKLYETLGDAKAGGHGGKNQGKGEQASGSEMVYGRTYGSGHPGSTLQGMGACCSGCASGSVCGGGALGAIPFVTSVFTGVTPAMVAGAGVVPGSPGAPGVAAPTTTIMGMDPTTLLVIAGLGIGAVILIKRHKAKAAASPAPTSNPRRRRR